MSPPTLRILSGGAAAGLVRQLQPAFEAAHGCRLEATFGAVGAMRDQLLADLRVEAKRAAYLALSGQSTLAGLQHRFTAGLLSTHFTARFNRQAYNWVGVGAVDGRTILPDDPTLTDENTNRRERSRAGDASYHAEYEEKMAAAGKSGQRPLPGVTSSRPRTGAPTRVPPSPWCCSGSRRPR